MTTHSRRFARHCREHFDTSQPQQAADAAAETEDTAKATAQPAPEGATASSAD